MLPRIAYGTLFCVALPALLVLWAMRLESVLGLPRLTPLAEGWWLAGAGFAGIAWSMIELWRRGRGLPMNAFPPRDAVESGPYRWLAHPIYVAAVLVAIGVSIACGSFAGLVIVSPALALGATALVLGFERQDLVRRFGRVPGGVGLRWPADAPEPPTMADQRALWARLFVPFLVLYEAIGHLPVPDPIDARIGDERFWPVLTWTTPVYSSVYPFVLIASLAAPSQRALRRWALDAWFGITLGLVAYLLVPLVAPPRPFDPAGLFAPLLALEQSDGLDGRAACPSFHVFWAIMAAALVAQRGWRPAILGCSLAIAICTTCITTGMHALVDVFAGATLALIAILRSHLWQSALAWAERVANSWREWHVGPHRSVRIIVHGLYAGLAATVGTLLIGCALGSERAWQGGVLAGASLIGAGLWGQYWVGSKKLLRPFGYFGSVLGVTLACAIVVPFGLDAWHLAAAVAMAAPWVQAIGRLRCLVQGCCHGAPCATGGIVYRHPRSRVLTIAKLGGVELHATPLYSMLANLLLGAILIRLWFLAVPCSAIVGAYGLLAGLSRFVEEAHRGEPQTKVYGGLRFYQWCALALVGAGGITSSIGSVAVPPFARPDLTIAVWSAAIGAIHAFAMGVDFPTSQRRFARLAD